MQRELESLRAQFAAVQEQQVSTQMAFEQQQALLAAIQLEQLQLQRQLQNEKDDASNTLARKDTMGDSVGSNPSSPLRGGSNVSSTYTSSTVSYLTSVMRTPRTRRRDARVAAAAAAAAVVPARTAAVGSSAALATSASRSTQRRSGPSSAAQGAAAAATPSIDVLPPTQEAPPAGWAAAAVGHDGAAVPLPLWLSGDGHAMDEPPTPDAATADALREAEAARAADALAAEAEAETAVFARAEEAARVAEAVVLAEGARTARAAREEAHARARTAEIRGVEKAEGAARRDIGLDAMITGAAVLEAAADALARARVDSLMALRTLARSMSAANHIDDGADADGRTGHRVIPMATHVPSPSATAPTDPLPSAQLGAGRGLALDTSAAAHPGAVASSGAGSSSPLPPPRPYAAPVAVGGAVSPAGNTHGAASRAHGASDAAKVVGDARGAAADVRDSSDGYYVDGAAAADAILFDAAAAFGSLTRPSLDVDPSSPLLAPAQGRQARESPGDPRPAAGAADGRGDGRGLDAVVPLPAHGGTSFTDSPSRGASPLPPSSDMPPAASGSLGRTGVGGSEAPPVDLAFIFPPTALTSGPLPTPASPQAAVLSAEDAQRIHADEDRARKGISFREESAWESLSQRIRVPR